MPCVSPRPGPIAESGTSLAGLLDCWNDEDYERTGVWLVSAGIDDYLDLVSHHRNALPTLSLDPNPYWMGFYAS